MKDLKVVHRIGMEIASTESESERSCVGGD